jgi:ATP-dependent Clp protease ATP-binding subunit ClpA
MKLDRFDKKINKIIERAYRLADFHFRKEVVLEDILKSIFLAKGSVAVEVLKKSGLMLNSEDMEVVEEINKIKDLGIDKIKLSQKVVQLLNRALAFALETKYHYVATEHLLLVLMEEGDKNLDKMLTERGVNIKELINNLKILTRKICFIILIMEKLIKWSTIFCKILIWKKIK